MYLASLVLFILCSVSDFLDGYLARRFNLESSLGKLFRSIADKILLCSAILAIILITNDYFIGLMGVIILTRGVLGFRIARIYRSKSDSGRIRCIFSCKNQNITSVYCYWILFLFRLAMI